MYRLLIAIALLSLTGCATTRNYACAHEFEVREALNLAMINTAFISDPIKQEIARSAIRIELAALDTCPIGN